MTAPTVPNTFRAGPDERGFFGIYGGRFVAETLMPLILDLEAAYKAAKADPKFHEELTDLNAHYAGRPSPLYFAERLTVHLGGAKIYLKRDELNHTGSHKINNCLGQILLARRMGKTADHRRDRGRAARRRHGHRRGALRLAVRRLHGRDRHRAAEAERLPHEAARRGASSPSPPAAATLKDAMNEALRDWVTNVEDTYYLIGTVAGPHPYPEMVRDFQSVIGREAREQILELEGRLPDALVACIGGGSNAIGLFHPFLDDRDVAMLWRRGRRLRPATCRTATPASMTGGRPGILHGNNTYLLQDERRPDSRGPLDLGRSRLSRRRAGALRGSRTPAGSTTFRRPTTRRWRRSRC